MPQSAKILTPEHIDIIREVSSIGSGHAATALSQLLNRRVNLNVPVVNLTSMKIVEDKLRPKVPEPVGVRLFMLGDVTGKLCLVMGNDDAMQTTRLMLSSRSMDPDMAQKMQSSAISEVGNILCSAFINALCGFLSKLIIPSIPKLVSGNFDEVFKAMLGEDKASREVFVIQSIMRFDDLNKDSKVLMLWALDAISVPVIVQTTKSIIM